jgi:HD-GYP domain-containing protein (c-di-GMP phosphodiesterase class II)
MQLDPESVPKGLERTFGCLREYGFDLVAPLTGKNRMFGILALGPRLSGGRAEPIDHEFLEILLNQAGVALENARLIRDLHDRNLGVAQTFVNLIEKRSGPGTRASTELISHYVGKVAAKINYPSDQIRDLVYGTVLRDIGMIEISDLVLKSPRSLSPEEWQLIKQHPLTGVNILSAMEFSETIKDVVLYHHERFNGEGYPHGLRGAAIPLSARIVSVVESFVAMTRDLPYRAALSRSEALEVIRENWGMRYDAEVLQAFLEIIEEEGEVEPVTDILVGAH